MQPTPYGLWVKLHFFTMCICKHCFLPMLLVFAMQCCTKMPCPLPHNHYCCSLHTPSCLPHLFNAHLYMPHLFAHCLPSIICVIMLMSIVFFILLFFIFLLYVAFICDFILACLCTYFLFRYDFITYAITLQLQVQ